MLKNKKGICIDCGPAKGEVYIYASGRCSFHYWTSRNKISVAKRSERFILYDKNKKDNGHLTLKEWFQYHVEKTGEQWICENCGTILYPYDYKVAKSCQAHILPKKDKQFPSVSTDINNRMLLGGLHQSCKCHDQYDSNWMNAVTMNIFPIALERFQLFKHKLTTAEIGRLPEHFKNIL